MPKMSLLVGGLVGAVVIVGGVVMMTANKDDSKTNDSGKAITSEASSGIKLDDPTGLYNFFSDPSVTKYPEENAIFGNGETLTFEYDGTKTNNDEYATLSYYPYYIMDNGKVSPMGGGNVEGRGKGIFSVSNKVYDSSAKNKTGFLELKGTYIKDGVGTTVTLGMYPIKFNVVE